LANTHEILFTFTRMLLKIVKKKILITKQRNKQENNVLNLK